MAWWVQDLTWVIAVMRILSLTRELLYAAGMAKRKKKKKAFLAALVQIPDSKDSYLIPFLPLRSFIQLALLMQQL